MTQPEDASLRTVVVTVAANLLIAVAKGIAALLTGSAAMLAETAHSIATPSMRCCCTRRPERRPSRQ